MSQKPTLEPDSELVMRMSRPTAQFEAAWQETLKGAAEPTIEAFLGDTVEPYRSKLRRALLKIDRKYRQLIPAEAGTTEFIPDQPAAGDGRSTEFIPSRAAEGDTKDTSPLEGGSTFQYDPRQTVNAADAGSGTVDSAAFSLAPEVALPSRLGRGPQAPPGYEILGELGRGSMGVVYKARQTGLNRLVALKMILAGAHADPDRLARFNVEAKAVAALQHANIVQIYEVGQHDGLPFFSLEYIDGGTLSAKLANQPQPPRQAAKTVEILARAMHYAHGHDIVHRDLKPGNIMLTAAGAPKVTDFGLAKRLEDDSVQTKSGTILGTPSFMAPEQARGDVKDVGPLADVYALGAILYAMLTGRPPFLAASVMETVRQVLNDEPVPPNRLQPQTPRDLETICLKCLQKEPSKRYATAEALANDLRRFLAEEPILARPVSAPERLWRWGRRNPRIAGLTAIILFLLVAGTILSSASAVKLAKERDEKEEQRQLAIQMAESEKEARKLADQKTEETKAALKLAFDNAQLAGESFNKLAVRVQDKLKDRPDLDDLRGALLNDALLGLDQVALVGGDSNLFIRTRGNIHQRKGDIFMRDGNTPKALEEFQQGLTVFEKLIAALPADDPERQLAKYNAAIVLDKLGETSHQKQGDVAGARQYYSKALSLREELAAGKLLSPKLTPALVQRVLANSYMKQATLALAVGDLKGAKAHLLKAQPLLESPLKTQSKDPGVKQGAAGLYVLLGDVSFRLQDVQGRREYYQKALKLRQELAAADASSVQAKRDVAATIGTLGDVEFQLQNPKTALEHYRRSFVLFDQLHRLEPKNVVLQRELSFAYYRLGAVQQRLGDLDAARKEFQSCLKLREATATADPENVHKEMELMLAEARCGLHLKAADRAEKLRKSKSTDPDVLYYVACSNALCVAAVEDGKAGNQITPEARRLQERYAALAIETLAQAIERGYNDRGQLQMEPDLDPVRDRPGFKGLLVKIKPQ